MSEKRFKTKYYLKGRQGIILGVVKVNEEDNVLDWNKVVDLLNGLAEENEQLKKRNKFLEEFDGRLKTVADFIEENKQLKQELQGMNELLQSYRKTIKHDAELLADASKNGYLPPLNDFVSADGWACVHCKHFHSGVRDRCDKDNNWVLNDGYCQDFEG